MTDEQITETPPLAAQRPPLTRSADHRVVAGVCGGLGRHLDIDPVVFRVVVAVLCLTGGLGLFLYGLAWLIVPRDARPEPKGASTPGHGSNEMQRVLNGQVDGQSIGAVLLTVIGTGVFFSSMSDGGQLFPLLLLGGLVFMAVRYDPERRRRARGLGRPQTPGGPYDRLPDPAGEDWQARKAELHEAIRTAREQHAEALRIGTVPADTPPAGPSGYLWDPRHPDRNPYAGPTPPPGLPPQAWWQRTDLPEGDPLRKPSAAATARGPERRRSRSFLGPLGLLLACGAGSLAWGLGSVQGSPTKLTTVCAAALLALGLTMLVGAKFGRARGLTVPAVLLILAIAGTAGTTTTLQGTVGDRSWAPTSLADVRPDYTLGVGQLDLDLSGLTGTTGSTRSTGTTTSSRAKVGVGDLHVTLPTDMEVRLTVRSSIGDVSLPDGEHLSGAGNHRTVDIHPLGGEPAKGTLDLDLTMGIGDIMVMQG